MTAPTKPAAELLAEAVRAYMTAIAAYEQEKEQEQEQEREPGSYIKALERELVEAQAERDEAVKNAVKNADAFATERDELRARVKELESDRPWIREANRADHLFARNEELTRALEEIDQRRSWARRWLVGCDCGRFLDAIYDITHAALRANESTASADGRERTAFDPIDSAVVTRGATTAQRDMELIRSQAVAERSHARAERAEAALADLRSAQVTNHCGNCESAVSRLAEAERLLGGLLGGECICFVSAPAKCWGCQRDAFLAARSAPSEEVKP